MMSRTLGATLSSLLLAVVLLLSLGARPATKPAVSPAAQHVGETCSMGATKVSPDGVRRMAVVVGIESYADGKSAPGASTLASTLAKTLIDGFDMKPQNVCVLSNGAATREAILAALKWAARQAELSPRSAVVVSFDALGSRSKVEAPERERDYEPTILLAGVGDPGLSESELLSLVGDSFPASADVTVWIDACDDPRDTANPSGPWCARGRATTESQVSVSTGPVDSVPRALVASKVLSRGAPPPAKVGGSATEALVRVLSETVAPLAWADVTQRVTRYTSSYGLRLETSGDPAPFVLLAASREPQLGMTITDVGPPVRLSGAPPPGWGPRARVRVFRRGAQVQELMDPTQAKGALEISAVSADGATSDTVVEGLAVGDRALLAFPAPTPLTVRIIDAGAEGVPSEFRQSLLRKLSAEDVAAVVKVDDVAGSFVVARGFGDTVHVRGPEGTTRRTFALDDPDAPTDIARLFERFSMQATWLAVAADNRAGERDDALRTAVVSAGGWKPAAGICPTPEAWAATAEEPRTRVPPCDRWKVQVSLPSAASEPLRVGGVLLTGDGEVVDLGTLVTVSPGAEPVTLPLSGGITTRPPFGVHDHLLIFGTSEAKAARSSDARSGAAGRSRADAKTVGGLLGLGGWIDRGEGPTEPDMSVTWTSVDVALEVDPSPILAGFPSDSGSGRMYGVQVDWAPYLPDNPDTALYRVLQQAEWLTNRGSQVPYKQRADWPDRPDEQVLAEGIDCSRSIWFAFTRANVPYTSDGTYLWTRAMADPKGPMNDEFSQCSGDVRTGDVLVYINPPRPDDEDCKEGCGHTVMVIDPLRHFAWGSHGWDGNAPNKNGGVGVQETKNASWEWWDRPSMKRVACWRHRQFSAEWDVPGGNPDASDLSSYCEEVCAQRLQQ
jgi:Caspase domain